MYVPSWQAWFGHIPNDAIDSIIKTCDTFPLQDALLGSDTEENPGHTNDTWRRSKVAFIPPYMPETNLLTAGIASKANEANRNAWGFNIGPQIYDIQYTKYYELRNVNLNSNSNQILSGCAENNYEYIILWFSSGIFQNH